MNDLDEVLLLLQVGKKLQGTDHGVACSRKRSGRIENTRVLKPASLIVSSVPCLLHATHTASQKLRTTHHLHCLFFLVWCPSDTHQMKSSIGNRPQCGHTHDKVKERDSLFETMSELRKSLKT